MKPNIGNKDRLIRLGIAAALFILAYFERSWLLLAASIFVFYEAFASWCILYSFLGKNSCPIKKD